MSDHPDGLSDLVTRTHISRRLHLTRAALARAVASHDFPAPLGRLGPSEVWRWSDVRAWAEDSAGRPGGPTPEGLRLAAIRDRFRGAGFRLKLAPDRDGGGWTATRVAPKRPTTAAGEVFHGKDAREAAESALEWLETHH
jgi:predicted DNA-binding transcriptional regulator AlpA